MSLLTDRVVTKTAGEKFEIKFEACHDGGYVWMLDTIDTTQIKMTGKTLAPAGSKQLIGGNVIEIWTFEGVKPGDYELTFNYKRPWLAAITKTETVRVIIK